MHKSGLSDQKNGDATQKLRGLSVMSDAASNYPDVFSAWVQRKYAPLKNARKLLARDARVSPRTAENWLQSKHPPKAEELIRLVATNDDLAEEIMRLVKETKCGL